MSPSIDITPATESKLPVPLKLSMEPAAIFIRLSPVPPLLTMAPLLIIAEVPESTVKVKLAEKSMVPVLLIVPPSNREAFAENSIVPALFNVPVKSLFLKRSLKFKLASLAIESSPAMTPPLKR